MMDTDVSRWRVQLMDDVMAPYEIDVGDQATEKVEEHLWMLRKATR